MKSFVRFINEARSPRPSALKKFKKGYDEKENVYIAGDIYDLSGDNRYTQVDKYYKGDGDGYIMSKNGTVYDVSVSEGTEDAGRIAGGCSTKSATIYRVGPNGESISLSGYSAIFSHPSSNTWGSIISDIKAGMWLEDYLKVHENDISFNTRDSAWVQAFISNGAKEYTSYEKEKADKKESKRLTFAERFLQLKSEYFMECTGGTSLKFSKAIANKYKDYTTYGPIAAINSPKGDKAVQIPGDAINKIESEIVKLAEELMKSKFPDIDCKGITFSFAFSWEGKMSFSGENFPMLAWDTKENKIAIVLYGKCKVLDRAYELRMGNAAKYDGGELAKGLEKVLKDISRAQIKSLGTEGEYVKKNYRDLAWGKGYWQAEHSNAEGREMAKAEFRALKAQHEFTAGKKFLFTLPELINVLGSGKYDNLKIVKKSEAPADADAGSTPEISNGPDKPAAPIKTAKETYGKAYDVAKEKMDKWHEGTRKQNLKNCNDGKLRMNFAICKELGYKDECDKISAEAKERGIVLESAITLKQYMQAIL